RRRRPRERTTFSGSRCATAVSAVADQRTDRKHTTAPCPSLCALFTPRNVQPARRRLLWKPCNAIAKSRRSERAPDGVFLAAVEGTEGPFSCPARATGRRRS